MTTSRAKRPRLDSIHRRNLAAATARILPSDDGAGAAETDAAAYIEHVLEEVVDIDARQRFVAGLDLLEDAAQDLCGRPFAVCSETEQDQIVEHLLRVPHRVTRRFVALLIHTTVQGFLCDPEHGGNHDALGWLYLRLPLAGDAGAS